MENELEPREVNHPYFEAVNWNNVSDFDKTVWDKLTSQFWLDTRLPLGNDISSWNTLTEEEKLLTVRVFTGLTMLDTIQSRFGADALKRDAENLHEEAIYNNIAFMESVHAKSYSSIFSTLCSTKEIDEAFRWGRENPWVLKKAEIIMGYYRDESDPHAALKRKVASTLLESFLFYSGFYLPFHWNSQAKLTNTAGIISLIVRDESVHGYYIGAKFQNGYNKLSSAEQEELKDWTYDLLMELYENEVRYTSDLYDGIGITEDVKTFLRYNANKALANLGLDPLFPKENPNPAVLNQLTGGTNHDFFSDTGNSYSMATVEDLDDDDFDF